MPPDARAQRRPAPAGNARRDCAFFLNSPERTGIVLSTLHSIGAGFYTQKDLRAWTFGCNIAINECAPAAARGDPTTPAAQLEDGSWYVKTRALGFQPYFDNGFPHGVDQWISGAATGWATMARSCRGIGRSPIGILDCGLRIWGTATHSRWCSRQRMLCAHGGSPSLPNRRAVVRNHLGFPLLLQSQPTMSFAFP